MPTKQIKIQLTQTLSNPVVVAVQIAGTTVFNSPITSEAAFDLDVPDAAPGDFSNTSNWTISVSGGPITISGILNNYSSINANVPGMGITTLGGSSFLYEAGIIATQPTFNGTADTNLYNISAYTVDGAVTGSGSLPIPNNTICSFDLKIGNWSQNPAWDPNTAYGSNGPAIRIYNDGYYVTVQPSPAGTLPTNTAYWTQVTDFQ